MVSMEIIRKLQIQNVIKLNLKIHCMRTCCCELLFINSNHVFLTFLAIVVIFSTFWRDVYETYEYQIEAKAKDISKYSKKGKKSS